MGENNSEWYEDEKFWASYAPLMFNSERWAMAEEEAAKASKLLSVKKGASLLDTCCGVGRHDIHFAQQGLKVTGVDRTEVYLDAAKESAAAEGLEVEFILDDMRRFSRQNAFNSAVNMFTSFGYFCSEQEEMLFLKNVFISLKDGGTFLIDVIGKEILARDFTDTECFEQDDIIIYQEFEIIEDWTRLQNRWLLIKDGERVDYTFSHAVYSARELKNMFKETGFNDISVYGSFDGTPYDEKAKRLIIVGTK